MEPTLTNNCIYEFSSISYENDSKNMQKLKKS